MRPSPAELSRLHVVVPVRGLRDGKARLTGVLDDDERGRLIMALLQHTLAVTLGWSGANTVHVVSHDPVVLSAAAEAGAIPVDEPQPADLNSALRAGRASAAAHGATAILYLPADLPLLSGQALDRLRDAADAALAAGSGRPVVVAAPADARSGTNALLLTPLEVIDPAFGGPSLAVHLQAAAEADASVQLVVDGELGFDLDLPADLARLEAPALAELLSPMRATAGAPA